MSDNKQLKIRLSEKEKDFLESKAKENSMSINQYVRYKILEAHEEQNFDAIDFLNKQLPLITRVIIDGYFHIRELAAQQISEDSLMELEKKTSEQIKKLNIQKKSVL